MRRVVRLHTAMTIRVFGLQISCGVLNTLAAIATLSLCIVVAASAQAERPSSAECPQGIRDYYDHDGITIMDAWTTQYNRFLAIAIRSDTGARELGFDIWSLPYVPGDELVGKSDRDVGDGDYELVLLNDLSDDGFPEILAIAWSEQGGTPVFYARRDSVWIELLQSLYRDEIPGTLGESDKVLIHRANDVVCAFSVPAIPVGGRSQVSGADYGPGWRAPMKTFWWDGIVLRLVADVDEVCGR